MTETIVVKEETDCMHSSMPVLPLVANGYSDHHGSCGGLEGKDAVLIHSNQTSLNAHQLNESVSRNSKENAIQTLERQLDDVREAKRDAVRAERNTRDIMEAIRLEGDRQRIFATELDSQRRRDDAIAARFLALEKLIEKNNEA